MKRTLLLTLAAVLLLPVLVLASGPAQPAAAPPCAELASPLATPAPAADEAVSLSPLDGALAMSGPGCCQSLRQQCAAMCNNKGGIAEFNCFAESCTASCFCNVFP